MKKYIFCVVLGLFFASVGADLCFSSDYNNPCTSPIATCTTKSDGSRWCGLPQQTMVLCTPPKINLPINKQPNTMSPYKPPSCSDQCESSYNECMAGVNEGRAKEGTGEFSALTDAAKYANCKVSRNTCYKRCN